MADILKMANAASVQPNNGFKKDKYELFDKLRPYGLQPYQHQSLF